MKKMILIFFVITLLAGTLFGCSQGSEQPNSISDSSDKPSVPDIGLPNTAGPDTNAPIGVQYPLVMSDTRGNSYEISAPVDNVICLDYPSLNAAFFACGGDKIAGYNKETLVGTLYTYLFPELENVPSVVKEGRIDYQAIEKIEGEKFTSLSEYNICEYDSLKEAGVMVDISSGNGEGYATFMNRVLVTELATNNMSKEHERLKEKIHAMSFEIEEILKDLTFSDRKSVLFLGDDMCSVSTHTVINEIIVLAQAYNAAEGVEVKSDIICASGAPLCEFTEVTAEQIVQWDPDVIWIPYFADYGVEDVFENPDFAGLKAVKTGDVYIFPCALEPWYYSTPAMNIGACWAAYNLYPDIYTYDILMENVKTFYDLMYGREFTEEQLGFER